MCSSIKDAYTFAQCTLGGGEGGDLAGWSKIPTLKQIAFEDGFPEICVNAQDGTKREAGAVLS